MGSKRPFSSRRSINATDGRQAGKKEDQHKDDDYSDEVNYSSLFPTTTSNFFKSSARAEQDMSAMVTALSQVICTNNNNNNNKNSITTTSAVGVGGHNNTKQPSDHQLVLMQQQQQDLQEQAGKQPGRHYRGVRQRHWGQWAAEILPVGASDSVHLVGGGAAHNNMAPMVAAERVVHRHPDSVIVAPPPPFYGQIDTYHDLHYYEQLLHSTYDINQDLQYHVASPTSSVSSSSHPQELNTRSRLRSYSPSAAASHDITDYNHNGYWNADSSSTS